jgi:protease-4
MSSQVSALFQSAVDHTYEEFLARVALGRSKTRDEIDAVAQGRVWAGSEAMRVGLVDRIGTYEDALKLAAERAKLATFHVKRIEPELTLAQQLFFDVHSDKEAMLRIIGLAPKSSGLPLLGQVEPVAQELERLKRLAAPGTIAAYCFCQVE